MSQKLTDLRTELTAQGFDVKEINKGWTIIPPDPAVDAVTVRSMEVDRRTYENILAQLRKAGFVRRR